MPSEEEVLASYEDKVEREKSKYASRRNKAFFSGLQAAAIAATTCTVVHVAATSASPWYRESLNWRWKFASATIVTMFRFAYEFENEHLRQFKQDGLDLALEQKQKRKEEMAAKTRRT
jgi:hypothetical protein